MKFRIEYNLTISRYRAARSVFNGQDAGEVSVAEINLLEVKLPTAEPEAFEMILNYIYTDRFAENAINKQF